MNHLVRVIAPRSIGYPGLEYEEFPVCNRHLQTIQGQVLDFTGMSSDVCKHCSVEWSELWQKLLRENHWLGEITEQDVIYIAGPMTGIDNYNRPAFYRMEHALKTRGARILSPAHWPDNMAYEWYLRKDFVMLMESNVSVFLTGWQESNGATIEHALSLQIKNRIYYEL